MEIIDSHVHLHPLSPFDRRSDEEIERVFEEFKARLEAEGYELFGVGGILFERQKLKLGTKKFWKGLMLEKFEDFEKFNDEFVFVKIDRDSLPAIEYFYGLIEKKRRVQIHSCPFTFKLTKARIQEMLRNDVKVYLVHGTYTISELGAEMLYNEKEELARLCKAHAGQLFMGTSPYNYLLLVEKHKNFVESVVKKFPESVVLESDFQPLNSYLDFFLDVMKLSLSPLNERQKEMVAYQNPLRFFE